jgi:hypothetical protein
MTLPQSIVMATCVAALGVVACFQGVAEAFWLFIGIGFVLMMVGAFDK